MPWPLSMVLWVGLTVVLFGCVGPPPAAQPTQDRAAVERGKQLFANKGCTACHGEDAQGTDVAPALPGHAAEQVRRQIRRPIRGMPAFRPDQISDAELEEVAAYIASLVPSDRHREPLRMPEPIVMHHWMTIMSLKAHNVSDAEHHVRHIVERAEGDHRRRMQEVLSFLRDGKLHDAEHETEEMLAGRALPGLSLAQLHLEAALSDLAVHDPAGAEHHMQHFLEQAAAPDRPKAERIVSDIRKGDLHQAEHGIQDLMPKR